MTEEVAWNVGDPCRAVFPDDGLEYEATIESLGETDGVPYANVVFLYYGNRQAVWLTELLVSHGPDVRALLEPTTVNPEAAVEAVTEDVAPTVVWNVGDMCRAIYSADGQVYDCTIESLTTDEEGNQVAEVVYVGYGNKETVWSKDLLPPAEGTLEEPVTVSPDDAISSDAAQDTVAAGMASQEIGEDKVLDVPEQVIVTATTPEHEIAQSASGDSETVAALTSSALVDHPSSPEWKKGDICRAVNPEDDIEYDGVIQDIVNTDDGMIATISIRGSDAKVFTAWLDSIIPSREASADSLSPRIERTAAVQAETSAMERTWEVGGPCRTLYSEDGLEYEATIEDISTSETGDKFATVELLGYGDRITVWLVDLIESHGNVAREKQEATVLAAKTKVEDDKVPVENTEGKGALEKASAEARAAEDKEMKKEAATAAEAARAADAKARQDEENAAAAAEAAREKREANAKALNDKKNTELRNAEAKSQQSELAAQGLIERTNFTLPNQVSASPIPASQAEEVTINPSQINLDISDSRDRPRTVSIMLPENYDTPMSRMIKFNQNSSVESDGDGLQTPLRYYVDHLAAGQFCRFKEPGSDVYIEGLIMETWYKEGGNTLCHVKVVGSDEDKYLRMKQITLSRGSKARAEQVAQFVSKGNVSVRDSADLESKLSSCQAKLEQCREEFAKSVLLNSSLMGKIEEKNFQNECLRTGNSELRAQLKRTEEQIRILQENYNVARENILAYQAKVALADQAMKDNKSLIVKLESSKREIEILRKRNNELRLASDNLANEIHSLKQRQATGLNFNSNGRL